MSLLRSTTKQDSETIVRGRRVYLRHPAMSDFEAWAALREESRDFLTPWEPTWPADDLTRSAFRRRLRRYQRDIRDDVAYPFFLFRRGDDAFMGAVTLSNVRRGVTQSCNMGYWVGEAFGGNGFMREGVSALIPWVFETLRLHRLEAACLPSNERSKRLLQACGFREEGFARGYLRINGRWEDHVLYAILDSDPRPDA